MILLSIIIPVYNVEKYIGKCIKSCLELKKYTSDFEIIIVNDGSPDNSIEVVKKTISDFPNFTLIDKKNGGLSSARNAGLKYAKGDYVWFVDSDDWINASPIYDLFPIFNTYNPDIINLDFLLSYVDGSVKKKYTSSLNGLVTNIKSINDKQTSVGIPFSIFKRSFLIENSLEFYEGIYHEDFEFKPRALFLASKVYYYHRICYYYYQRPIGSIMSSIKLKNGLDAMTIAKSLYFFEIENNMIFSEKLIFNTKIGAMISYMLYVAKLLPDKNERQIILNTLSSNRKVVRRMILNKKITYFFLGLILCFSVSLSFKVYQNIIK